MALTAETDDEEIRRIPMPKKTAAAALLAALLAGSVSGLPSEPERETGRESPKDEIGKPLAELAAGKRDPRKDDGVQRFKGLGEMPASELWVTTMNPETRLLLQVTLDDAAQADELFSVLMGEDVESRRSFIQRNAKDVRFLDI